MNFRDALIYTLKISDDLNECTVASVSMYNMFFLCKRMNHECRRICAVIVIASNLNLPLSFVTDRNALYIYLSLNKRSKAADCCQIHIYILLIAVGGNCVMATNQIRFARVILYTIIVCCAEIETKNANIEKSFQNVILSQTITQVIPVVMNCLYLSHSFVLISGRPRRV